MTDKHRLRVLSALILIGVIFVIAIIFRLLNSLESVLWISAMWGLAALLAAAAVMSIWRRFSTSASTADIAQGVAAMVTIVAFVVAARIYFLERRDKAGVGFDIVATRALISTAGAGNTGRRGERNRVLLGIQLVLTNHSSRQIEMKCIAIALYRPVSSGALGRSRSTPEEIGLESIVEPISYDGVTGRRDQAGGITDGDRDALQIRECLGADLNRQRERASAAGEQAPAVAPSSVRPLFMWGPLRLEPNDVDDRYFEIAVDCEVPFVRVLAKMRINPFDRDVYEAKAIIPLREICEGHAEGSAKSVTSDGQFMPEADSTAPVAPAVRED